MTAATAQQMTFLDAVEAYAPKQLTLSAASFADDGLPPPTHAQVYYWRELAGAITLCGSAGMPDNGWPADLNPPRQTLKQLEERQLVVRRGRAWHLRRHWYTRLQVLRQRAVDTPMLTPAERPAPDLPTYAELKGFEALCLYLDATPKCRARLPFTGWATRIESIGDEASIEADVPVTLLKLMRRYKLVRHSSSCEWALSPRWRERLQLLWRGVNTALRDYMPPEFTPRFPRSLVAGIDTWHLSWLVDDPLPAQLRERLATWQQQAREAEAEAETDLSYDGSPLLMYRWGTKAESGGGVSWGYVLLNSSLRLLIRKAPLGGIIAQARLGSECLWRRTPKGALDELTLLMKRLWRGQSGRWQVSQVHLCHDVANAPLELDLLSRVVSRSRTNAIYEAAQADIERARRQAQQDRDGDFDGDDMDFPPVLDWVAMYADDDPLSVFALGTLDTFDAFGEDALPQDAPPVEECASTSYRWGKRISGITLSAGAAISFAMYLKRLESRLRGKVHMFPIWTAVGWDGEEEVTRFEARLRRDALRELRLLFGSTSGDRPCLDDPYEMLQHLSELFALIVGRLDECPDAINTAWIRLVTPREDDTNRSRWDTDPLWRVVQSPRFADAPIAARRMIRRKQRSHDVEKLVAALYGYLISLVAAQHQEGERWDVSRAVRELATSLVKESEKPKKDFGELVRQRRKERGLPVLQRESVLPPLSVRRTGLGLGSPVLPTEGADQREGMGMAHQRASVRCAAHVAGSPGSGGGRTAHAAVT